MPLKDIHVAIYSSMSISENILRLDSLESFPGGVILPTVSYMLFRELITT